MYLKNISKSHVPQEYQIRKHKERTSLPGKPKGLQTVGPKLYKTYKKLYKPRLPAWPVPKLLAKSTTEKKDNIKINSPDSQK